jgi:hypothetical protein
MIEMNYQEFKSSLKDNVAPPSINPYLKALWLDGKGRWDEAHQIVQDIQDANGAWVHAYLHRKEGDQSNAGYWYGMAGKKMPDGSLEREWEEMVMEFLERVSSHGHR